VVSWRIVSREIVKRILNLNLIAKRKKKRGDW
jgi:hypothetical protein